VIEIMEGVKEEVEKDGEVRRKERYNDLVMML
jgi:hypothetical protein